MTAARARNFTIDSAPRYPAADGVPRLMLELSDEMAARVDSHIGLPYRGAGEADRAQDLSSGDSWLPIIVDRVASVKQRI